MKGNVTSDLEALADDSKCVPLEVAVFLEEGSQLGPTEVDGILNIMGCSEDRERPPYLSLATGFGGVRFRYEKVSKRIENRRFQIRLSVPGASTCRPYSTTACAPAASKT